MILDLCQNSSKNKWFSTCAHTCTSQPNSNVTSTCTTLPYSNVPYTCSRLPSSNVTSTCITLPCVVLVACKNQCCLTICVRQHPTTSNQQPTTNNQQPRTNNKQPRTNNNKKTKKTTNLLAGKVVLKPPQNLYCNNQWFFDDLSFRPRIPILF